MEKQCRDVIEFMKLRIHIVNTLNIKDIMKFVIRKGYVLIQC
mgnify:CR=1 FL=1